MEILLGHPRVCITSGAERFPEKTKKLFVVDHREKAFWLAEEFGTKKVNRMKEFLVPSFGDQVFFREVKKGNWLAVVQYKKGCWVLYEFFGKESHPEDNCLFPGEFVWDVL